MKSVFIRLFLVGSLGVFSLGLALQQHVEPNAPIPEENAKLMIWSVTPGLEEIAKLFNLRHNLNIQTRTFNTGTELYRNLQKALATGIGVPDVARVEYAFIPWLQKTQGLLELPKITGVFAPWTNAQVTSLGAVYGVPQDIGALALVYRQDILSRYNLTPPRTWADFARLGSSLATKSNNQVKLMNFDRSSLFFAALCWAQGARFWTREENGFTQTLDTPLSRQIMSYWGTLIRQNQVTTMSEYSVEHWNALRSGRLMSAIVPAWALAAYTRNLEPAVTKGAVYRLMALPNAGRASSGNLGGSSLVIPKVTQFPKAATAFALFAATSAESISHFWNAEAKLPAMNVGFDLPEVGGQVTQVFNENPIEVYRAASNGIPEKFDWSPWLPSTDVVYRKLFDAALENKITFGQFTKLWQEQSLDRAWKEGFAVR
jgi:multiple sugar transport system substrate-binding protein